jgi:hypothetical protein
MQDLKRRLENKEAEVDKLVAQVSRRKEERMSGGGACVYPESACESVYICGEVCVYVQGDVCICCTCMRYAVCAVSAKLLKIFLC